MDSITKPVLSNPQRGAWFGSQLFFIWIVPLLWSGSKNGFGSANLTKCLPVDSSAQLGDQLEVEWQREQRKATSAKRSPKLRNALLRTVSSSIVPQGVLFLLAMFCKSFLPFVLAQLLILIQQPPTCNPSTESSKAFMFQTFIENAWQNKSVVGAILGIVSLTSAICFHHAEQKQRMVGSKMRIACCSLIFRKTLRMSKLAASQTSAGYLINLLSNDVNRLDLGFMYAHYVWILPIQASFITFLIYQRIGWPAFIGVIVLLVKTVPVQSGLSRMLARLRLRVALKTDERVGIMHELVQGIQVIKMYAWEPFFSASVLMAREQELRQVSYAAYIRCFNMCTSVFSERTTLFITIITCSLIGQGTTADVVFSMAQYFNVLQLTAAIFYPLALSYGGEAMVSITRVEELLLYEEHAQLTEPSVESSKRASSENAVELIQVSAVWDSHFQENSLDNISLNIKAGKLCAIVGAVGAGKSSLLHLLLGELTVSAGNMLLAEKASISYASQEPWLFAGSVRNNILFGEPYEHQRYTKVVQCCSLVRDFELFANGDKTMVGERGASLSGGQRARIGLARSVYKQASIYLLDDPLSAVDAHVGKHLFEQVIGPHGFLAQSKSTRILVTHQVHLVQKADHIVILDQGRIVQQGSYAEISDNKTLNFLQLADQTDDHEVPYTEDRANTVSDLATRQSSLRSRPSVTYSKTRRQSNISSMSENTFDEADDDQQEQKTVSEGTARAWMHYFGAGSNVWQLIWMVAVMVFSQMVISRTDLYLTYWTDREEQRFNGILEDQSKVIDLVVFGALLLLLIVFVFLRGVLLFKICVRTSNALHCRMLSSLLGAQMRMFDVNPSGRILNRFSKDLGAVDEIMPCALAETFQTMLLILGILCVISIVNPAMLIVLAGSLVFFGILLKIYIRAAQDLKRMEGITRSPVFSYMSASLNGISTIRSCGLESVLVSEFDGLQDVHSAVWRLAMAGNSALGLWLDSLCVLFILCVTFSFIYIFNESSSSSVGMALSQAMTLVSYVQWGVRQTTLAMQQLTNVERVLEYTRLDKEIETEVEPPTDWPQTGNISVTKMSLRYSPDAQPTLCDLTLDIQTGWKVGIVGRTGAGKSSIIAALFRLAIIDGTISVDSIDTATIALKYLRSRVSIIPQDPVLFSATIRSNLDPFNRFSDDELWKAIGAVELKSTIASLDFMITEAGSNFSIGQRQLICLARAILRQDRILVLDEATANVDQQTDALIQRTIRERFVHSTVLTIAHRLRTVMDSDRILVMDAGRIAEFDIPHVLLQKPDGVFSQMVKATGQEAESLRAVAELTYTQLYYTDM